MKGTSFSCWLNYLNEAYVISAPLLAQGKNEKIEEMCVFRTSVVVALSETMQSLVKVKLKVELCDSNGFIGKEFYCDISQQDLEKVGDCYVIHE